MIVNGLNAIRLNHALIPGRSMKVLSKIEK